MKDLSNNKAEAGNAILIEWSMSSNDDFVGIESQFVNNQVCVQRVMMPIENISILFTKYIYFQNDILKLWPESRLDFLNILLLRN